MVNETLNHTEIGHRIQIARRGLHLTQEAFAELAGLSLTHVCAIENGYSGASLPAISRMASILNVSLDWLVFGSSKEGFDEIYGILNDCTPEEQQILISVLKAVKGALTQKK